MELHDILNENGNPTGEKKTLSEIHSNGLLHGVVHVWIVNSEKEIMFQKRSLKKVINPGLWDFTAGGHVDENEDFLSAAIRETKEEVGIDIDQKDLKFICADIVKLNITDLRKPGLHNHYIKTYLLNKDISIEDIVLDEEEAIDVKYFSLEEFEMIIENKNPEFAQHEREYKTLLKDIKNL